MTLPARCEQRLERWARCVLPVDHTRPPKGIKASPCDDGRWKVRR